MSEIKKILERFGVLASSKNGDDDHTKRMKSLQGILDSMGPGTIPITSSTRSGYSPYNRNVPPVARNYGSSGSSGFSGYSGNSGYSGFKSYFTRQEVIDAYLAGYKAMQLIDEEIKPEIIEMAKQYADNS